MLGVEKATLTYTLLTALFVVLLWGRMERPADLLEGRALVVLGLSVCGGIYRLAPCRATLLLRHMYPLTLLGYWYPDTYEFCRNFPNLDYVFAAADQALTGCQPSLVFSRAVSSKLWSELFHMGYFSYYPLIALTVLAPLATERRLFGRTVFVVVVSFFLYYLIYLFLPVAGPQYYFHAIGSEAAEAGSFARLGDYFRFHTDMNPSPGSDGVFRRLVEAAQSGGERPTAAFPSSHVGIGTVLMLLLRENRRYLMWCALPFYVLLCCATVYIEAHYLVDVFGGLATAFAFYYMAKRLYAHAERPGLADV